MYPQYEINLVPTKNRAAPQPHKLSPPITPGIAAIERSRTWRTKWTARQSRFALGGAHLAMTSARTDPNSIKF